MNLELLRCRVCGLVQREPPWGLDGQSPSFNICPCCGVEFGYEDSDPSALASYRSSWLANGATWFRPKERPAGWSLDDQLAEVPAPWRDLGEDDQGDK
jgi:hypothetical protein